MASDECIMFPRRAFIQQWDGAFPPDYQLVVDELQSRGVEIVGKSTQEFMSGCVPLTKTDLVVGDFMWTRQALNQLKLPMPSAPDYPDSLKHLLHRKVWQSTLQQVKAFLDSSAADKPTQIFIKPAIDAKAFAAIIEPRDQMLDALLFGIPLVMEPLPPDLPVHCAEVVDMREEHRVYIVNGEIRSICCYRGLTRGEPSRLDLEVVRQAVRDFCDSDEGQALAGCAADFAVIHKPIPVDGDSSSSSNSSKSQSDEEMTCLVEVNDGYSLGRYPGLSGKDYTDLLVMRWQQLMK